MTKICCFSGSGHSLAVAETLSQMTGYAIEQIPSAITETAETAVVVFPVYCQNIPVPVKAFLKNLGAKYVVLIATYGKISYGNVLYEAARLVSGEVIAGAYIPIGHTFLSGDTGFRTDFLLPILERIASPQKADIPKTRKALFADLFPGFRSRIGGHIRKSAACDSCGLCEKSCPMDACCSGVPNHRCIRCLRCVTNCPQKALVYENSRILRWYLNRYRKEEYRLYL